MLPLGFGMGTARYRRFTEVLQLWQSRRRKPTLSWDSPRRLLGSAALLEAYAVEHLHAVLQTSDEQLAPLRDPLKLNLGEHRWLSDDREESYSDWLAWILQGTASAAEILPFFGIEGGETIDERPAISREEIIKDGRTDIQVRSGTRLLLLIEVKIQVPGSDLFQQLEKYAAWVAEHEAVRKLKVLLGPEGVVAWLDSQESTVGLHGFEIIGWRTLCLRLRRYAHQIKESDVMRAAAILIFCGAVEQNLLGLSALPRRFRAMATVDYLESWRR